MARHKILTKEARAYIVGQIREMGEMSKSEIAESIRPHCSFDPITLQEQAINRLVSTICRSIRDEYGTRSVFIAKGKDTVVDVDTSTSLSLVSVVDEQIKANIKGLQASMKKTEGKRAELSGQASMFAASR